MLTINELLSQRGLDLSRKTKIVRHQDRRYDVNSLIRAGQFEVYQGFQSKPVFECDFVIACVGHGPGRARFLGVYRKLGRRAKGTVKLPRGYTYPDMSVAKAYYYELRKEPGFEDLEDRVVMDWGAGALAWHQWLAKRDREVIEILPKGFVKTFPGYLDFVLTFEELRRIVSHPEENRDWHDMLGAVSGVYVITDQRTGRHYVGAAYGRDGILGRWRAYAKTGHGGNRRLERLTSSRKNYASNFTFTVLRVMDRTTPDIEVLAQEELVRRKLGKTAISLTEP
jgi:hypothetical protein